MSKNLRHRLAAAALCAAAVLIGFQAAGKLSFWQKLGFGKNELPIYADRPIKFSHNVHATKEGIACTDCHVKAEKEDKAGMPALAACLNCHDNDQDRASKINPFLVNGQPQWTNVTAVTPDVKFSHQKHVGYNVACDECHKGVKQSEAVSEAFHVSMDNCLDCHAAKKVAADCKTCHQTITKDWMPKTHEQNWKRFHGQVVEGNWEDKSYSNRCSMCHAEATCTKCHQDEQPINHTAHWRELGHGVAAEMNRSNCSVCHRTDFCDRCHRELEPRSHRAGWGGPRNRHCLT